jgi:nuclear cap-binding protein subunit 1
MEYWKDQPGIGVNIVDKLLNYTILSPASVVEWALGKQGKRLGEAFVYEMVSATVGKVTGRVRQVVRATKAPGLTSEQRKLLEGSAESERGSMRELFRLMEDLLVGWAGGSKDQVLESSDGESEGEKMVRQWGERWLRVFRRKFAVEEAWGLEVGKQRVEDVVAVPEANGGNGVVEMVE